MIGPGDTTGATRIALTAQAGGRYTLQASETLTTKTDLTSLTATTNRIEFTDVPTNAPTRRFYRVRQN